MVTPAEVTEALRALMVNPDDSGLRITSLHAIRAAADLSDADQLCSMLSDHERAFFDASAELLGMNLMLARLRDALVGDLTREARHELLAQLMETWRDPRLSAPFDMSRFVGGKTDA